MSPLAELHVPDPTERDDLGAFVARAVRLDASAVLRLRSRDGRVTAWFVTPFDALATRSVPGSVDPPDLTVSASELLASLAVVGGERVDPGTPRDAMWRSALPPEHGWLEVEQVPADVIAGLADRGAAVAREHPGPHGPSASLLDQKVLTVSGAGLEVAIPLRCLFALSGMGFVGGHAEGETIRLWATDSWLRLEARYGSVLRRRHALLPLLV